MPDKRLLSVAEIARELNVPESTLHYWKNRFSPYLPSQGRNRQKRFKPEAVDIFRTISEMLHQGHTARDVMVVLSRRFPVNASLAAEDAAEEASAPALSGGGMEPAMKFAAAIGAEIAKAVGEGIRSVLAPGAAALPPGLTEDVERTLAAVAEQGQATAVLRQENEDLKAKLAVMEAELVRLRKDRRELEKYLLDKVRSVTK